MQNRPQTRLHVIINGKLEQYLTQDNPEKSSSYWGTFYAWIGQTERIHAKGYQQEINSIINENELNQQVLDDLFMDKSAVPLRRRLLEAMCEYHKIDLLELDEIVKDRMSRIIQATAYYGTCLPNFDMERDQYMQERLQRKTKWCRTIDNDVKSTDIEMRSRK